MKDRHPRLKAPAMIAFVLLGLATIAARGQQPNAPAQVATPVGGCGLLVPMGQEVQDPKAATKNWIVRSRAVTLDPGMLGVLEQDPPEGLTIELFDDVSVQPVFRHFNSLAPGEYTWTGSLADNELSSFVLSVHDEVMVAVFRSITKGTHEVRTGGDGIHFVREVDPAKQGRCGGGIAPVVDPHEIAPEEIRGGDAGSRGSTISVLVVSTTAASAPGGTQALANACIADTNDRFANSNISHRVELAAAWRVGYVESGEAGTDLQRLREVGDGYMDEVHGWRTYLGADLVALIVDDFALDPDTAGIGYRPVVAMSADLAFSVTVADYAVSNGTFAHELGHNFSCHHHPSDNGAGNDPTIYDYGFGHRYHVLPLSWYRTTMAYNDDPGHTRISHFSNPDVDHGNGVFDAPTGTGTRDNARVIDNTGAAVAAYMTPSSPNEIWVDDDYTAGNCDGHTWGYDAFDTMFEAVLFIEAPGVIHVAAGLYDHPAAITMLNQVEILGAGPSASIIRSGYNSWVGPIPAVVAEAGIDATAVLDGFKIVAAACPPCPPTNGLYSVGSPTVRNCNFHREYSGGMTGGFARGVLCDGGAPTFTDCTFTQDLPPSQGGIMPAMEVAYAGPTLRNCRFTNNGSLVSALFSTGSALTLVDCTFSGNEGQKVMLSEDCTGTLDRCAFTGNATARMAMENVNSDLVITNSTFSGNTSGGAESAAMHNLGSSPTIINCTFSRNDSVAAADSVSSAGGSVPTLTNCILWNGGAPDANGQIDGPANVTYSCVEGGWAGMGNMDADPRFMDADGPDNTPGTQDDDLRLMSTSPAIDAGNDEALPAGITADMGGGPRIQQCEIDMGAYEVAVGVDCNNNGLTDGCECAPFPWTLFENTTGAGDQTFTGPPDDQYAGIGGQVVTYDLVDALAADAAGPDFNVYEVDQGGPEFHSLDDVAVSADGVDFYSIIDSEGPVVRIPGDEMNADDAFARSYDIGSSGLSVVRYIRLDGVGDGAGGGSAGFDLDAIGVIHVAGDCNTNGVPDECDIADGTSDDMNGNGFPDECDPVSGDLDGDGDVDLDDCFIFVECLDGPDTGYPQGCDAADLDIDGDVDLNDAALFQMAFAGSM